jgi:hypothetical protein
MIHPWHRLLYFFASQRAENMLIRPQRLNGPQGAHMECAVAGGGRKFQ